ncbi:YjzC family protein [Oceanobacillus jordanicus]|uniref:YjzC family protein n=1 Tax=Oceanobacillus jordanicus TaxID=2867266 RepID=A0AAW5B9A2_9BACI|nr:YjzC family protein [Oceanobacillus jordanicus]MCG3420966.1 YjzC family protein [Oceanobacillus jordanicus]
MGEYSHFRSGQKVPNNGIYREIGETGSNVNDPQFIELKAGEKFPETMNQNRVWAREK